MSAIPCKDCFSGVLHSEKPSGTVTTLHGLPTYVSEPEGGAAPKGIIVVHTDAFGWDLPNSRVLADHYAKRTGCRVYTPDFMNGCAMPHDMLETMEYMLNPQPTWGATLWKIFPILRSLYQAPLMIIRNRMTVVRPRTFQFFTDLRKAEAKDLPLGIAGFCFGGLYVFQLAKDLERVNGKPLIDCGFTAHPSRLAVPKDGEEAKVPVSVIIGDNDMALNVEKAKELKTVLEKGDSGSEVNILPGVKHGFAVRWNPHSEKENAWAMQAEDQAVNFYKKQLKI